MPVTRYRWHLDLWNLDEKHLDNPAWLKTFCRRLITAAEMELAPRRHPQVWQTDGKGTLWGPGISILAHVTDSTVAIHTLSEKREVVVDIISCKPLLIHRLSSYVISTFRGEEQYSSAGYYVWPTP